MTCRASKIAIGIVFCLTMLLGQKEELVTYRGRYTNTDYGFSMTIPDGLVGEGNPPHAPNHGFAISLGPNGRIWVDASYEMPDSPHKFGVFNTRLGTLKAERKSRRDAESGVTLFQEEIVARGFDRATPIVYTIQVDCEPARKNAALRVFQMVVRSFRNFRVEALE